MLHLTRPEPDRRMPSETETDQACEPDLAPKLDPRLALGLSHVLLVAFCGALFVLMNHIPLRATDLWVHVTYGTWILEHRELPTEDPFCPLAAGVPVVDTAWLSQVILAAVERFGGLEWLSHLFALTGLATYLVLARVFYLQSKSPLVVLLGLIAVVVAGWSRISTIRPENFATLCFAGLLWLIVSHERALDARTRGWGRLWLGVPTVMALWANLHGSYPCGLAVLGCFALGRLVEVAWQTRRPWALLADGWLWGWLVLTGLGTLATLLNPYGVELWRSTLAFPSNPNLKDLLEWQPLALTGVGGREFALSWVVLLVVLRHSRCPIPAAHVLVLGVFALGATFGIRMLGWYAIVFGLVLVPHLAELLGRLRAGDEPAKPLEPRRETKGRPVVLPRGRSFVATLICLLLIWVAFAFSPISAPLLGRPLRAPRQLLGPSTPVALTAYLRSQPPPGPVFSPQWWGDWLVWDGPPGLRPLMTSNVHLIPPAAWRDYRQIASALPGWSSLLDRYAVKTVILDKAEQRVLVAALRNSRQWQIAYEDPQAVLFRCAPRMSE